MDSLIWHIEKDQDRLHILVNGILGGGRYAQWDRKLLRHDISGGLKMLRMGIDTHLITSARALPQMIKTGNAPLVKMTDVIRPDSEINDKGLSADETGCRHP
ncbi:hypothetical protein IX51_05905 [uncultured archaeon]|nr:hypothetical protein IX51_05905 [uncultured archaeon]